MNDRAVEVDPEAPIAQAQAEAATSATYALYLSAIRCVVTYVVLPGLGAATALSRVLTPATVLLQVVAVCFAVAATRRLWRTRHRLRWAYLAFTAILTAMAIDSLIRAFT